MIIHERSVTKEYWSAIYDYIVRRLNTNRFHKIPGTNVLHVYGGDNTRTYTILSTEPDTRGMPIAWLYLGKRPTWKAWEVRQVWVFPDWRGEGLAAKIYKAAVNKEGIILASGKTQAKSARALWLKLVRDEVFNIWAQDFNDLDLRSAVWFEDDMLHSDLELYVNPRRGWYSLKHDVRLIAIRK
jgi:hypothetical protein